AAPQRSLLSSRAGAPVGCPAEFAATRAGAGQTACEAARRPEKRWEVTVRGKLTVARRTISIQSAILSGFPAMNQPFFHPLKDLRTGARGWRKYESAIHTHSTHSPMHCASKPEIARTPRYFPSQRW